MNSAHLGGLPATPPAEARADAAGGAEPASRPEVRPPARATRGERIADRARDAAGSWVFLTLVAALVGIEVAAAIGGGWSGPAVLGTSLAGLALLELSVLLMSVRRCALIADEHARAEQESLRRASAAAGEVRDDLEQLRGDIARLVARLETSSRRPAEGNETIR